MSKSTSLLAKNLRDKLEKWGAKSRLAEKTGISYSGIDGYLAGKSITLEQLDRLAEGLGCQAIDLISDHAPVAPVAAKAPHSLETLTASLTHLVLELQKERLDINKEVGELRAIIAKHEAKTTEQIGQALKVPHDIIQELDVLGSMDTIRELIKEVKKVQAVRPSKKRSV